MPQGFQKIVYESLNARQKESFNFQKVSAVLADYGFITIKLSDDWHGADFIAQHLSGETLKVQLKGRLSFYKKYQGKDLRICFRAENEWYFYPHDELLERILAETNIGNTESWVNHGGYSFPGFSQQLKMMLEPYRFVE